MYKVATGLYINEVEILKNELQSYKDSIIVKIREYSDRVCISWKEDRIKYSYTIQGWCMDKDEDRHGELILTPEQISTISNFNQIIAYYEGKK